MVNDMLLMTFELCSREGMDAKASMLDNMQMEVCATGHLAHTLLNRVILYRGAIGGLALSFYFVRFCVDKSR